MAGNSVVRVRIWPNFELLRALMHVIITCRSEKDRIKTAEKKWQHQVLDAQGQVTPWSEVGSGRILNSTKPLCM